MLNQKEDRLVIDMLHGFSPHYGLFFFSESSPLVSLFFLLPFHLPLLCLQEDNLEIRQKVFVKQSVLCILLLLQGGLEWKALQFWNQSWALTLALQISSHMFILLTSFNIRTVLTLQADMRIKQKPVKHLVLVRHIEGIKQQLLLILPAFIMLLLVCYFKL